MLASSSTFKNCKYMHTYLFARGALLLVEKKKKIYFQTKPQQTAQK